MAGESIGHWTVLGMAVNISGKRVGWFCRCDCGRYKTKRVPRNSISCGCAIPDLSRRRFLVHGKSRKKDPLYSAWINIKQRCFNHRNKEFKNYGARGIRLCDRWLKFSTFMSDLHSEIGYRPVGKSLDRINNSLGYQPGNVRWATAIEQSENRRVTRLITYGGKTMSMAAWAREVGTTGPTISSRIRRGLPLSEVLS